MAYEDLTMQAKPAHAGKRSDLDAEERHGTLGSAMARLEMTSKRQEDLPEKEQRMTIRRELIDELLTEYKTTPGYFRRRWPTQRTHEGGDRTLSGN